MGGFLQPETAARMTTDELARRYVDVCGEPARTLNPGCLTPKVAWLLQALAEGDLSGRAWRRASEPAMDADVRAMPHTSRPPIQMPPIHRQ